MKRSVQVLVVIVTLAAVLSLRQMYALHSAGAVININIRMPFRPADTANPSATPSSESEPVPAEQVTPMPSSPQRSVDSVVPKDAAKAVSGETAPKPTPPSKWVPRLHHPNPDDCMKKFSALGYTSRFNICTPPKEADLTSVSSIECANNPSARATLCDAKNILLEPAALRVAAGGETIQSVFGRAEEDEFPRYQPGAFKVKGCTLTPGAGELPHYLSSVIQAVTENGDLPCEQWIEEPTLLITRYEYANLYHTSTDWYNMWATLDWAGLLEAREDTLTPNGDQITRPRPHRVVWLDGHAQGALDSAWTTMFTPNITLLGQIKKRTCFRRAIFVPAGYSSPTYDWPDGCGAQPAVREFSNFVVAQFGLDTVPLIPTRTTFMFRESYIAHPRNPSGSASRHVANRNAIEDILRRKNGVSMNPVELSFRDQLKMMRETRLFAGVHGAGLTHVLFMQKEGTMLLELQPPTHRLSHFEKLARWSGVQYFNTPPQLNLVLVGQEDYNVPANEFEHFITEHLQ